MNPTRPYTCNYKKKTLGLSPSITYEIQKTKGLGLISIDSIMSQLRKQFGGYVFSRKTADGKYLIRTTEKIAGSYLQTFLMVVGAKLVETKK